MPKPKSKKELVEMSKRNYHRLLDLVESLSKKELQAEFPKGYMNRNVRDVLAHLHHWHLMMLEWHKIGMTGSKPDMPATGYTWKTVPDLNKEIWVKYRKIDLQKVRSSLDNSFREVQKIIEKYSDQELFEKQKFKWTGTTSLGAYLISATSSHYDWA